MEREPTGHPTIGSSLGLVASPEPQPRTPGWSWLRLLLQSVSFRYILTRIHEEIGSTGQGV